MIFLEALEQHGLSNKVLKRIFTAKPPPAKPEPSKKKKLRDSGDAQPVLDDRAPDALETLPKNPTDWDVRRYLETLIDGEISEGLAQCAENFNRCAAMDLAYTQKPIHPLSLPIMQVAMGYISLDACHAQIAGISSEWKEKLFEKDAHGKPCAVKAPALLPFTHNLVHSLVTRRVAALATELYQQHPLMKFDPFSNTEEGHLIADVSTQIAERMAGDFGYRHDNEESIRQASLHGSSFKFKSKAWHVDRQWVPENKPASGAGNTGRNAKQEYRRKIVREGVQFTITDPSRTYYDTSRPLSKLNHGGLGPQWLGHWEAVRIGDIKDDPAYWDTESLSQDADIYSLYAQSPGYFAQYYGNLDFNEGLSEAQRMSNQPASVSAGVMALANDREANIGKHAQLHRNAPTILFQHYKRVIPKNVGLGRYEDPVWIRFVLAGGRKVVFAEIVGSEPASVNSYNSTDGLLASPTFGMRAAQWQDMLTNQFTELRHTMAQGLVRIWCLNIHGMEKPEIEIVEKALKDPDFTELKDIVIKYNAELLAQRAQDINTIKEKIAQIRVETQTKVGEIWNNIVQTLALAERDLFFSPQELGQVAARTTSATEQKAIQQTTLGIRDYHLTGVKLQIDADKRIIHESYMAFGSEDIEAPVAQEYSEEVIRSAGFDVVDTRPPKDGLYTIRGKKLGLLYNYTYTTKNTDDTPPDAALAQLYGQLYDAASKNPVLAGMLTNRQHIDIFNMFTRAANPRFPRISLPKGVDPDGRAGSQVEQVMQMMPQIAQALDLLKKTQEQQAQQLAQTASGLDTVAKSVAKLAQSVQPPAARVRPKTPQPERARAMPLIG